MEKNKRQENNQESGSKESNSGSEDSAKTVTGQGNDYCTLS